MVVSPDGHRVYVTANTSSTILILDRDADNGMLTHIETYPTQVLRSGPGPINITPDGSIYLGLQDADCFEVLTTD